MRENHRRLGAIAGRQVQHRSTSQTRLNRSRRLKANPKDSPGAERFRIRCERPPTAARLYRIAEVELLDEADDSEDSAGCMQQHAQAVSLFSELMSRLTSLGDFVATNDVGDRAAIPILLAKSETLF